MTGGDIIPDKAPRRYPRWIRRVLLGLVLGVVAAIGALQIPAVRTAVVNRVLASVNPYPDASLRVRSTSGSVVRSLQLHGLALETAEGEALVSVDTLSAHYNALAAIFGRIRVGDFRVVGLHGSARRDSTGALDLAAPFGADSTAGADLRIERLTVRDSDFRLTDPAGIWKLARLQADVRDIQTLPSIRLVLDSLSAEVVDPLLGMPGQLLLVGSVDSNAVRLDSLLFSTNRSHVEAAGQVTGLHWPPHAAWLNAVAEPLQFDDVRPLFPALAAGDSASVSLQTEFTGGSLTAELAARLGGGAVTGTATGNVPSQTSAASLDALISASRVDFARVTPGLAPGGYADLEASAVLQGDDWSTLSGTSQFTSTRSEWADVEVVGVQSRETWTNGAVRTVASGFVNGGEVRIDATLSPAASGRALDVRALLNDWPLARWSGGDDLGQLNSDVRLLGALSGGTWEATANLAGSRLGTCQLAGDLALESRGTQSTLSGALKACDGTLDIAADYDSEQRAWKLTEALAAKLPVSALLGDTTRSSFSGLLQGAGRGQEFSAALMADEVLYGPVRIDSSLARARGSLENWSLGGSIWSGPGEAVVALSSAGGLGRIDSIAFSSVDAAYSLGLDALESDLSGAASGEFSLVDKSASATFTAHPSTLVDAAIVAGGGTASFGVSNPGVLASTGELQLALGAGLAWELTRDSETGETVLNEVVLRDLNPRELWSQSPPMRLSGSGSGVINGANVRSNWSLGDSDINGLGLRAAELVLEANPATAQLAATFNFDRGSTSLSANLDRGSRDFDAIVGSDSLDILRVLGLDNSGSMLSGFSTTNGTLSDAGLDRVSTRIHHLNFVNGPIRVDSAAGLVSWERGLIRLDSVRIAGTPLRGTINGTIPLDSTAASGQYTVLGSMELDNVAPLAALFGVELQTAGASVALAGTGRPGAFRLSTQSTVEGIRQGDLHVARASLVSTSQFRAGPLPHSTEIRAFGSVLSVPGIALDGGSITATIQDDSVRVTSQLRIGPGRTIDLGADANMAFNRFVVDKMDATLDDAAWGLVAPVEVVLTDGVQVSGIVAMADSQRIALGGYAGSSIGDDMYLSASNVRIDALADVLGYTGFGATVSSTLSLTSDGPEAYPSISGTVAGAIRHQSKVVGHIDGRVALINQRLNLDANMVHASGSSALVRGFLPVAFGGEDISAEPVSMRLETEGFPIAWTLPFFDPAQIDLIGGLISGDVAIRGTYGEPQLGGDAHLADGRMGIPILGKRDRSLVYEDGEIYVTFQDDAVKVDSARVRSGPGTAFATGGVDLRNLALGEIHLDMLARDFLAVDSEEYRAVAGGSLRMTGTTRTPVLGGDLRIERGDFYLTDEVTAATFEPVTLSDRDLLALEERFGIRVSESDTTTFDFYEAMQISDLQVGLARNSWLRSSSNPTMDIQFTGNIDVTKEPAEDVLVFGTIEVLPDRSRIVQFGRSFEIDEGTLTFNGPATSPTMSLGAVYDVRSRGSSGNEVTIRLRATGTPEDLTVAFVSDPAMELADILSYIATGRPASESLQFGGTASEDYLRSAAGLAVGPITTLVENLAGQGLGLDVVEIEQDETSGLMLTAGKYVSPRFFVSVSQPIALNSSSGTSSENPTEVTMEYEIIRSLLVSLLSRGTVLQANLRWQRAF